MDMALVGCNTGTKIRAAGDMDGESRYYLAHCPQGITGVKRYASIVYENVYDLIDLEYLFVGGRVKYSFIAHPGARVEDIRMLQGEALSRGAHIMRMDASSLKNGSSMIEIHAGGTTSMHMITVRR